MKNEVTIQVPDFVKKAIKDCEEKGILPTDSKFETYNRGKSCGYNSEPAYISSEYYFGFSVSFNDSRKGEVIKYVSLYIKKPKYKVYNFQVDSKEVDSLPCTVTLSDEDGLTFKLNIK